MRIFEKYGISAKDNILDIDKFVIFSDLDIMEPREEVKQAVISCAEKLLDKKYPYFTASMYLDYYRTGNRVDYDNPFLNRLTGMITFLFAEVFEGKKRFSDKVLDLAWMLLEQSTWVIPAHHFLGETELPYDWNPDRQDNIDLFAGMTAASLSWVYYYADKVFPEYAKTVKERILYELDKRIFNPMMNCEILSWMGYHMPAHLKKMNNWGPWVSLNILTAVALCVDDSKKREQYTGKMMEVIDNYLNGLEIDGGCEEGATYWGAAAGMLFSELELLYDMSGGKIDIFNNELIKNVGEYILKVNISDNKYITFSDTKYSIKTDYRKIARFGRRIGSNALKAFGASRFPENNNKPYSYGFVGVGIDYGSIKNLFDLEYEKEEIVRPESVYFPSIYTMIQYSSKTKLYLAAKGGNNLESHNHNDVGSFILYKSGQPVFIDVGIGIYTRDTFNQKARNKMWNIRSSYHNLPSFGEYEQVFGGEYTSNDVVYDSENRSLSMRLENAYDREAGINQYKRVICYDENKITIEDSYSQQKKNNVIFNFILADKPKIENNTITLSKSLQISCNKEAKIILERIVLEDKGIRLGWKRDELWRLRFDIGNALENNIVFEII